MEVLRVIKRKFKFLLSSFDEMLAAICTHTNAVLEVEIGHPISDAARKSRTAFCMAKLIDQELVKGLSL
jgi:hypothetical protein